MHMGFLIALKKTEKKKQLMESTCILSDCLPEIRILCPVFIVKTDFYRTGLLCFSSRPVIDANAWTNALSGKGDEIPDLAEKGKSKFVGPERIN